MTVSESNSEIFLAATDHRNLFAQLHLMIDAGIPILEALEALSRAPGPAGLAAARVARQLFEGAELEVAFARASPIFDKLILGLLALGRKTGSFCEVLRRLAQRSEEACERREHLRSALTYPLGILTLAILCCLVLAWLLLPQLTAVLESLGSEPPLPTRLLLAVSAYRFTLFNLFALPLLVLAFFHRFRGQELKTWWRRLLPKIPVLGGLSRLQAHTQLSQDLALALQAGLPLAETFRLLSASHHDPELGKALKSISRALGEGEDLDEILRGQSIFDDLLRQSLVVGLESGKLVALLQGVAKSYEAELRFQTSRLLALLEPTVMLVLGIITGFVVLASLLPIYEVTALS